ncbi:hypothetical protein [Iodobacter fluviatilis]|uniref:Uncharacterized protein n=1 Tax=Iodobacter fluviatilis TaxID=537 RepID=A0A377Q9J5_9NEIS|nr:hypothetical protein [Iodobacter fluviatilis]TCU88690.1 hypothetical protein EV682_103274 [Iodobacter fluviatilis]STQ91239.1 Uncharacterised protein [Iodobacter fluviatilis]
MQFYPEAMPNYAKYNGNQHQLIYSLLASTIKLTLAHTKGI